MLSTLRDAIEQRGLAIEQCFECLVAVSVEIAPSGTDGDGRGKHAELRSGNCLPSAEQDCQHHRLDNGRYGDDIGRSGCAFAERVAARRTAVRQRGSCPYHLFHYRTCLNTVAASTFRGVRYAHEFDVRDDVRQQRPADTATAPGEYHHG